MAINTITLATKMTDALDKAITQKSVTGFLADNAMKAKFTGARTVQIPRMGQNGMGNYDRDNGFPQGSLTVDYVSYTMTMDCGRTFQLDTQDADESGVASLAGQVMGEFIRNQVVPEVDAYTLSKLASYAITAGQTITPTGTWPNNAYTIFTGLTNSIQAKLGFDRQLVAFCDPDFYAALMSTTEIDRQITVSEFKQGGVNLEVKSINGIVLRPVQSARMFSAYTFNDGTTAGQTVGGFKPTAQAQKVRLLVMDKQCAMLVRKAEKTRVFSPDTNQKADAWKFDMRLYYDCFVRDSAKGGVYAYAVAQ